MQNKQKIIRKKDIKDLKEKESKSLFNFSNHYKKFKMLTRMLKWVILRLLVFTLRTSQFIDAINNIITHIEKWFPKI